jgi:hypothetical protein
VTEERCHGWSHCARVAALAGEDRVRAGALQPEDEPDDDRDRSRRGGESVRVPTTRVHNLLDDVGEAELDVRRVARVTGQVSPIAREQLTARGSCATPSRRAASRCPRSGRGVHALVALADQLGAAAAT